MAGDRAREPEPEPESDGSADALDADERALFRRSLPPWLTGRGEPRYALTRAAVARAIAAMYLVAFVIAARQLVPLVGEHGILPAAWFLDDLVFGAGSRLSGFVELPTVFLATGPSDAALAAVAWVGVALAAAALAGVSHPALFAALWLIQLSITHVGQVFWGYGWEMLLLEAGFLAIFLYPLRGWRPLVARAAAPAVVMWLYRWLTFRLMFGAGLIKLRGDPCWRDLTCLEHHFETQPLPSPLTPFFDGLPAGVLDAGVAVNHFVEIVVPFGLFGPRRVREAAAAITIAFQLVLILSGNLSFLNWLTIAVAIPCFDDRTLARLVPRRLRTRVEEISRDAPRSLLHERVVFGLGVIVLVLSVTPTVNLFSSRQLMNASFDRLHLVNTYGAFGSVNRVRHEVILEGTRDDPADPDARWLAYELPCKPGDPARAPCFVSPYQPRLDWQMWFAALSDYEHEPWIVRLVWLLLQGDTDTIEPLIARDPFRGRDPPRAVRARLFRYELTGRTSPWWRRTYVASYLDPLTLDDPELRGFLEENGLVR